jgi:hypothetical protein
MVRRNREEERNEGRTEKKRNEKNTHIITPLNTQPLLTPNTKALLDASGRSSLPLPQLTNRLVDGIIVDEFAVVAGHHVTERSDDFLTILGSVDLVVFRSVDVPSLNLLTLSHLVDGGRARGRVVTVARVEEDAGDVETVRAVVPAIAAEIDVLVDGGGSDSEKGCREESGSRSRKKNRSGSRTRGRASGRVVTMSRMERNTRNIKTILAIIPTISTKLNVLMGDNSRKGSRQRSGSGNRSINITGSNSSSSGRMMTMTRMERNARNIQTIVILVVIPAISTGNTASSQSVRRTRTNGRARGRMMTMARVKGDTRNIKTVFTVIPAITTERRDTLDIDLDVSLSLSLLGVRVKGEVREGDSVLINRVIPSASVRGSWVRHWKVGLGGADNAPADDFGISGAGSVNGFSLVEASVDGGLLMRSLLVLFLRLVG